jgi:hypothetical protein
LRFAASAVIGVEEPGSCGGWRRRRRREGNAEDGTGRGRPAVILTFSSVWCGRRPGPARSLVLRVPLPASGWRGSPLLGQGTGGSGRACGHRHGGDIFHNVIVQDSRPPLLPPLPLRALKFRALPASTLPQARVTKRRQRGGGLAHTRARGAGGSEGRGDRRTDGRTDARPRLGHIPMPGGSGSRAGRRARGADS